MTVAGVALVAAAVALGAAAQRVTGMGFALVSSPLLVLVAGAFEGVVLANVFGAVTALGVLALTWRHVDWPRGLLLLGPALVGVAVGGWVTRQLPHAWLEVVVGGLIVTALLALRFAPHLVPLGGRPGAVAAGTASGFMNVTAGVGGPAMVLYAVATHWPQARFAATFQFYTLVVSTSSILAKGGSHMPAVTYAVGGLGLACGLAVGSLPARRVTPDQARRSVVLLALVGGATTLVKGALALAAG